MHSSSSTGNTSSWTEAPMTAADESRIMPTQSRIMTRGWILRKKP
jgi:hypothetical protein